VSGGVAAAGAGITGGANALSAGVVGGALAAAAAIGAGAALVATHSKVVTDPVASAANTAAAATGGAVSAAAGSVAAAAAAASNAVADAAEAGVKTALMHGQAAAASLADTAVWSANGTAAAATAVGAGMARGVSELSAGVVNEVGVKASEAGAAVLSLPEKVAPPKPAEVKPGPRAGQPHGFRRAPLAPLPEKPEAAPTPRPKGTVMYPLERRPRSPLPQPAPAAAAVVAEPPTLALLASALRVSDVRYRGGDAWVAPRLSAPQRTWLARGIAGLGGAAAAGAASAAVGKALSLLSSAALHLGSQADPVREARRQAQPVYTPVDVAQNTVVRGAKALILAAACAAFAFGVVAVLRPRNFFGRRKGKGKAAAPGLAAFWPLNLL
jgi:hypothetical protein